MAEAAKPVPYAETRTHGWWVVTAEVDGLRLAATSRDRERARRIVESMADHAGCGPLPGPAPARPGPDRSDPTRRTTSPPGPIRARSPCASTRRRSATATRAGSGPSRPLTAAAGAQLFDRLRSAPAKAATTCTAPNPSEIRVALRFATADGPREVFVAAAGCPDGDGPGYGGIDDGTTVRALTRDVCRAVLQPPLRLEAASGDVGRLCLG